MGWTAPVTPETVPTIKSVRGTWPDDHATTDRTPPAGTVLPSSAMVEGGHTIGLRWSIGVESPLTDDERDILAGIAVMMMAVANRQGFPVPTEPEPQEQPCGRLNSKGEVCISETGHQGRHTFRPIASGMEMN